MSEKHDIVTREDIVLLVEEFYGTAMHDELLAPHFEGLDFPAHKPRMVAFWAFVALEEPGYTTNVFDKHTHLTISKPHFDRWVEIFETTVDRLFEGEKANDVKFRAKTIGWTFAEKMRKLRE
jgi:hemoglobin